MSSGVSAERPWRTPAPPPGAEPGRVPFGRPVEGLPGLPQHSACRARAANLRAEGREDDARRLEAAHREATQHFLENLYLQSHVKRELLARLPLEGAAALIAQAHGMDHAPLLSRGCLCGMRDHLRGNALVYAESDNPPTFEIPWPKVLGGGEGATVQAIGRNAFVAMTADATVRHRSSLVRIGDDLLIDAERAELEDIPIHLHVDPAVLDCRDGEVVTLADPAELVMQLEEAVHLGGVPSYAFGHWIVQFLLKYFAARRSGLLPAVPILIDAEMPATHREALEYFLCGPEVRIVELPQARSARVSRLWLLGDWIYVPLCPVPGQDLGPRRLSLPPEETAAVVRWMLERRGPETSHAPERLFLARRPARHRKLVNHLEIEETVRRRGFRVVHLEDHSFAEQIALVRGAGEIAGPDGSSLLMCLFANPRTKVTILSHPFMENNASLVALLDATGLDVLMVQGRCVREDAGYKRFSDYEIEPADLEEALSR